MSNKCCDPCNQEKSSVCSCNISGINNTTVTQPDDNSYLVSSPFYEVISSDDSINVNKQIDGETTTFDIQKECCEDIKVGACEGDTNPGALFNHKLRVDTNGPLTYSLINCPGDAYVQIGFNGSAVSGGTNQVSAASGCSSGYLNEILESSSPYFNFTVGTGCKYLLTPQPRKLFRAELRLPTAYVATLSGGTTDGRSVGTMSVNTTHSSAIGLATVGGVQTQTVIIPRSGWYDISLHGSYICSGVHALRNQLVYANTLSPLIDLREEGSWRVDMNANDIIDQQSELNQEITYNLVSDIASGNGEELSISYAMRGNGFGGSKGTYLTEGTEILFVYKYNTIVKNTFVTGLNHNIVYMGRGTDAHTNGEGAGTGRSIVELPEYTLTD